MGDVVGLQLSRERVGDNDGPSVPGVGLPVGLFVTDVGLFVGGSVGGVRVGDLVGLAVAFVGLRLGADVSSVPVGDTLGERVGRVGLLVGTLVVGE